MHIVGSCYLTTIRFMETLTTLIVMMAEPVEFQVRTLV